MPKQSKSEILIILDEAIALITSHGNDYLWSSWNGVEDALVVLQNYRDEVAEGNYSHLVELGIIFAPTGPMQELSLSNGWGKEFIALAKRWDQVIAAS